MNRGSHYPDINVRASLRAGSKARRTDPLTLLLSGLILVAATAPAAATSACRRNPLCSVAVGMKKDLNQPQPAASEADALAAAKAHGRAQDAAIDWENLKFEPFDWSAVPP